jgi:hypothetical protein
VNVDLSAKPQSTACLRRSSTEIQRHLSDRRLPASLTRSIVLPGVTRVVAPRGNRTTCPHITAQWDCRTRLAAVPGLRPTSKDARTRIAVFCYGQAPALSAMLLRQPSRRPDRSAEKGNARATSVRVRSLPQEQTALSTWLADDGPDRPRQNAKLSQRSRPTRASISHDEASYASSRRTRESARRARPSTGGCLDRSRRAVHSSVTTVDSSSSTLRTDRGAILRATRFCACL